MKNNKKKLKNQVRVLKYSFTGNNITKYSGLNVIAKYINRKNIIPGLRSLFPTTWYNATKFSTLQVLLGIIYSSLSGINRLCHISNFTSDPLVKAHLNLFNKIDAATLSGTLKKLGQAGSRLLESFLLKRSSLWLQESGLKSITLDADSTVSMVCGNQEGAKKGFNTVKKGAKSYHPLLVFVSEIKLLYHTWFRSGDAYTSNGIASFLKQVRASLPSCVQKVFFRADSGFFDGKLFDLCESFGWDYLVKVRLKGLKKLLENQTWILQNPKKGLYCCQIKYKAKGWGTERTLFAIKTVKKYVQVDYFGKKQLVPVYQYACYISNIGLDAEILHELYRERSESETWIEQVKSQLMAGKTLTHNFWANDILWQLQTFAYNISTMLRGRHKRFSRQGHQTFKRWFIEVPAKLIKSGNVTEIKMYQNHQEKIRWLEFENYANAV